MPYRLVADAINSGHRYALIYTDLLYQILSVFIYVLVIIDNHRQWGRCV